MRRVCDRLGYISGNNFGWTFDVRAEPKPTDLAYTTIALLAHTDQPYRQPVPGIQLLHCLRNEAPGGDSTLADGLAGAEALAAADPAAHAALVETEMEFRYDMVTDTVVSHGQLLEYDRERPLPPDPAQHQARRAVAAARVRPRRLLPRAALADRVAQRSGPPGDVPARAGRRDVHGQLRVLHGRTEFDASQGRAPSAGRVHRPRRPRHDVPPRRARRGGRRRSAA